MHFSRALLNAALPEWRIFFISYARLKRLLRAIARSDSSSSDDGDGGGGGATAAGALRRGAAPPADAQPEHFWQALDEELARVERFYAAKLEWSEAAVAAIEAAAASLAADGAAQSLQLRQQQQRLAEVRSEEEAREEGPGGRDTDAVVDAGAGAGGAMAKPTSPAPAAEATSPTMTAPSPLPLSSIGAGIASTSAGRRVRLPRPPSPPFEDGMLPSLAVLEVPDATVAAGGSMAPTWPPRTLLPPRSGPSPLGGAGGGLAPQALPAMARAPRASPAAAATPTQFSTPSRGGGACDDDLLETASAGDTPSLFSSPDRARSAGAGPGIGAAEGSAPIFGRSSSFGGRGRGSDSLRTSALLAAQRRRVSGADSIGDTDVDDGGDGDADGEGEGGGAGRSDRDAAGSAFEVDTEAEDAGPDAEGAGADRPAAGFRVASGRELIAGMEAAAAMQRERERERVSKGEDTDGDTLTRSSSWLSLTASAPGSAGGAARNGAEAERLRFVQFFRSGSDSKSAEVGGASGSLATIEEAAVGAGGGSGAGAGVGADTDAASFHSPDREGGVGAHASPSAAAAAEMHLRFVRERKRAHDLVAELALLAEYLRLNDRACYKIVKKHDKVLRRTTREAFLERLHAPGSRFAFLLGARVAELAARAGAAEAALRRLAPQQAAWARTRVLTVGTFDLAHHGHVNLLRSMRAFGRTSVVGIHDDASYALLKGAPPADALAVRMAAIRAHCDTLFVVPHTDPTAALAAIVTREDLARGRCVYVRGDDMALFPGRPWCEQMRIPIFLLPRSDGVSSSLIKAMASALAPVGGEAAGEGEGRALALALGRLDEAQRPVADESAGASAGKSVVAAAASGAEETDAEAKSAV